MTNPETETPLEEYEISREIEKAFWLGGATNAAAFGKVAEYIAKIHSEIDVLKDKIDVLKDQINTQPPTA